MEGFLSLPMCSQSPLRHLSKRNGCVGEREMNEARWLGGEGFLVLLIVGCTCLRKSSVRLAFGIGFCVLYPRWQDPGMWFHRDKMKAGDTVLSEQPSHNSPKPPKGHSAVPESRIPRQCEQCESVRQREEFTLEEAIGDYDQPPPPENCYGRKWERKERSWKGNAVRNFRVSEKHSSMMIPTGALPATSAHVSSARAGAELLWVKVSTVTHGLVGRVSVFGNITLFCVAATRTLITRIMHKKHSSWKKFWQKR